MGQSCTDSVWRGISKCDECGVRHLVLFSDLKAEDMLLNPLPIDDMSFSDGGVLYNEGEEGVSVFTVRDGLVKLIQHLPNGAKRIVRLLRRGQVAGLETLLGEPYHHTAEAVQPTLVCRIPCETIHRLNRDTPRLHKQLMRRFQDSVQQADEWLTKLSTGNARARVARLFFYLQLDPNEPTCELFSREDVASMLSITPETASRIIADFKRSGVIDQQASNHFRFDPDGLAEIAMN